MAQIPAWIRIDPSATQWQVKKKDNSSPVKDTSSVNTKADDATFHGNGRCQSPM